MLTAVSKQQELNYANCFLRLVHKSLSLFNLVEVPAGEDELGIENQRHSIYIQVLADVNQLMQNEFTFDLCLGIFEECVDLLPESKAVLFFNSQDKAYPIVFLLKRLHNPQVPV